jgi:hypothetical protein
MSDLKRQEENLRIRLAELHKNKPKHNVDERFLADMTRIESELTAAKEELVCDVSFLMGCVGRRPSSTVLHSRARLNWASRT